MCWISDKKRRRQRRQRVSELYQLWPFRNLISSLTIHNVFNLSSATWEEETTAIRISRAKKESEKSRTGSIDQRRSIDECTRQPADASVDVSAFPVQSDCWWFGFFRVWSPRTGSVQADFIYNSSCRSRSRRRLSLPFFRYDSVRPLFFFLTIFLL